MSFNRKINQSIKHGYIYLVPTLQLKQFIITTLAKEQGDLLLSWRVDVYEVSIIIWRSDHIHADYFKPWYQLFNIINRAFIFNISIWMLHNVRTLNIYFLAHFKKKVSMSTRKTFDPLTIHNQFHWATQNKNYFHNIRRNFL